MESDVATRLARGSWCLALALVFGLSGCGDDGRPVARLTSTTTAASPSDAPTGATRTPWGKPGLPTVPARDRALMRDFVAFAVDPSDETARPLPFGPTVRLGLGSELRTTVDGEDVADAAVWGINARSFRAASGRFSALQLVRAHARETGSANVGADSTAFEVSVGDHAHCASPPMPAPRGLGDARRVSVHPTQRSTDSCLEWFSVDLFLDAAGTISAVTLDVWEP